MSRVMLIVFGITIWISFAAASSIITGFEYCQSEAFKAQCRKHEFITITRARYGRMQIGRCIQKSYGFCSVDVLSEADEKCSGKSECEIRVTDAHMDKRLMARCDGAMELSRYLEIAYRCDKAVTTENSCTAPIPVQVQSGFLTSDFVNQTGCGNMSSPWILQAQAGQTLNISMIDFNWGIANLKKCDIHYGYIVDLQTQQMINICGGGLRNSHIYLSKANSLQIVIESDMAKIARFVLKYEAIGCPDLVQPKDSILHRTGNKTVVECHSGKQQWHLNCQGTKWVGVIGNCTQQAAAIARLSRSGSSGFGIPHGIAIFLVAIISLIICATIIFIGVMVLRRYPTPKPMYCSPSTVVRNSKCSNSKHQQIEANYNTPYPQSHDLDIDVKKHLSANQRNDYMHIWEHPLPDPTQDEYPESRDPNNPHLVSGGFAVGSGGKIVKHPTGEHQQHQFGPIPAMQCGDNSIITPCDAQQQHKFNFGCGKYDYNARVQCTDHNENCDNNVFTRSIQASNNISAGSNSFST